jgi:hypothetical protein
MFESFRGASAELNRSGAWGEVKFDIFGGAPVYLDGEESGEKLFGLVGGRLTYETPLEGLSIGGTFATVHEREEEPGEEVKTGTKSIYGGSLDYKRAGAHLSGEYFYLNGIDHDKYGYYAEAAYTFFDRLTPFVRYDYFTSDKKLKADSAYYQKGVVFGAGYKFNNFVALKVEDHIINGFALPQKEYKESREDTMPALLAGDKHWNLFAVSLNLMF